MAKININKELKDVDKKKIRYAKKKTVKFIKMYNNMCSDCKRKAMTNPRREMSEYCETCQKMMEDVF